jgi:subtilisin-like proprotein convertase family protein
MASQRDFNPANNTSFNIALALDYGHFLSTETIVINDAVPATPYPAHLTIAGLEGVIRQLTVFLRNLNHEFAGDLDVLLVSPRQQPLLLMSDAGGNAPLTNVTLTFSDLAAVDLPASGLFSGLYRPTDYPPADAFLSPAPAGPYATRLSAFQGEDPNGVWSLYVCDDLGVHTGSILGGWSLLFDLEQPPPRLAIAQQGGRVVLSWPVAAEGYVLEAKAQLSSPGGWDTLTNSPVRVGDHNAVALDRSGGAGFFRLRKSESP